MYVYKLLCPIRYETPCMIILMFNFEEYNLFLQIIWKYDYFDQQF